MMPSANNKNATTAQTDRAAISSELRRMIGRDLQWWLDVANTAYLWSLIIVEVKSYAQDAEAALFAQQIIAGLEAGGIEVRENLASIMPFGGFVMGIAVGGPNQTLARLVANSIGSRGFAVALDNSVVPAPKSVDTSAPDVSILVGVKPVPKIKPNIIR